MSISLVVNKTPFDYPEQGDQAPWGEGATNWAKEVTKVLDGYVIGLYDIPETSINLQNGVSAFLEIPSFSFDISKVRSFEAIGTIVRKKNDNSQIVETFIINGVNLGESWVITQEGIGDSGVVLDISPNGTIKYTSSTIVEITSSVLTFKAKASAIT